MLDMGAEQRLDILFGISPYLLEFIESHNTWLVCLFKTGKNFCQSIFRSCHIAELKTEFRKSCHRIKPELCTYGLQPLNKGRQHFPALGMELGKYRMPELENELLQAFGMQDINIENIMVISKFRFAAAESDQFGFAHTTMRHKTDVVSPGKCTDNSLRLFLSVAEILFRNLAGDDERIHGHAVCVRQI